MNPELRFKNGLGNDYPDWEQKKIDNVCKIQTGSGNTQDKEDYAQYPFYVRSPIIEHSSKYIFDCEAVLTVGDGVGVGNVYHYINGKFNCHQRVYTMNEFNDIDGKYFYFFFSTHFGKRVKSMTAKTSVDSVRRDMIANMDIQMPKDIKEQEKIAKLLSDIDEKIEKHAMYVEKLRNAKDAMLVKMFPQEGQKFPEIRFKGFSGGWEEKKLGDELLIQRGGSPRPIEAYITNKDGFNWIKIGDAPVNGNRIIDVKEKIIKDGTRYSRAVYRGDLILSNSMSFGRPYILEVDGYIHDGWLLLRDEKHQFSLAFLCEVLGSKLVTQQYTKLAAGSTVNNLNKDLVSEVIISIPPTKGEQEKIGRFFTILDKKIETNQQKYDKLCDVKKALLSKLFPTKEDE